MKILAAFALVLVLAVVFGALLALPTMLLVNGIFSAAALKAVFGGPLSFLGAWGINILCGLLFKTSVSSSKD
jgi:hypothetical protein